MKSRKRKRKFTPPDWKDDLFGPLLGEGLIGIVVLLITAGFLFFIPHEFIKKISGDLLIFFAFLIFAAIVGAVFLTIHLKRKRKLKAIGKTEYYKIYHRMYETIWDLYNDLKDTVTDIKFINQKIILSYQSATMEIRKRASGYAALINNGREIYWEDADIYYYALEFAHDNRKNRSELEISDDQIIEIQKHGIMYSDAFDRTFRIDFADCVCELTKQQPHNSNCVGNRDSANLSYTFYTPRIKTKIVFDSGFVCGKKSHLLCGKRKKRFEDLHKAVLKYGYTIFDLNNNQIQ